MTATTRSSPARASNNVSGGSRPGQLPLSPTGSPGDYVDGGADPDTLVLNGDFSAGVSFGQSDIKDLENFTLDAGGKYNITLDTSHFALPQHQAQLYVVDGAAVSDAITLDWRVGTQNDVNITGGSGNDTITLNEAGQNGHVGQVYLTEGGDDTLIVSNYPYQHTGDGEDSIFVYYGATFTSADVVENAAIFLDGDYSAGVTLNPSDRTLSITMAAGHRFYKIHHRPQHRTRRQPALFRRRRTVGHDLRGRLRDGGGTREFRHQRHRRDIHRQRRRRHLHIKRHR